MQKSRRQLHLSITLYCLSSYIWFKYDILLLRCCDLRSVAIKAFAFQPSHAGLICAWVTNAWNGSIWSIDAVCRSGKGNARSNVVFLLENLALQLGLGQRCQPEGIAITCQQLFLLWKRRIVLLDCSCLHKFWMTSFSSLKASKAEVL